MSSKEELNPLSSQVWTETEIAAPLDGPSSILLQWDNCLHSWIFLGWPC